MTRRTGGLLHLYRHPVRAVREPFELLDLAIPRPEQVARNELLELVPDLNELSSSN
jgi:hypothetical protein